MYGLVNRAIEGLLRSAHGEATWDEVRRRAGVDVDYFTRMQTYDDPVTYSLVGAASEVLDVPADDLLEAFGRYWVRYVATEGYGPLMDASGHTFVEFLDQLDPLHARVGMTYREMRPPSFQVDRVDARTLVLHYRSTRVGLTAMVTGLLYGLAERFETNVAVTVRPRGEEDHDIFDIVIVDP